MNRALHDVDRLAQAAPPALAAAPEARKVRRVGIVLTDAIWGRGVPRRGVPSCGPLKVSR
jgi:hypothetical protein